MFALASLTGRSWPANVFGYCTSFIFFVLFCLSHCSLHCCRVRASHWKHSQSCCFVLKNWALNREYMIHEFDAIQFRFASPAHSFSLCSFIIWFSAVQLFYSLLEFFLFDWLTSWIYQTATRKLEFILFSSASIETSSFSLSRFGTLILHHLHVDDRPEKIW